jgi:hypothetical protein
MYPSPVTGRLRPCPLAIDHDRRELLVIAAGLYAKTLAQAMLSGFAVSAPGDSGATGRDLPATSIARRLSGVSRLTRPGLPTR